MPPNSQDGYKPPHNANLHFLSWGQTADAAVDGGPAQRFVGGSNGNSLPFRLDAAATCAGQAVAAGKRVISNAGGAAELFIAGRTGSRFTLGASSRRYRRLLHRPLQYYRLC